MGGNSSSPKQYYEEINLTTFPARRRNTHEKSSLSIETELEPELIELILKLEHNRGGYAQETNEEGLLKISLTELAQRRKELRDHKCWQCSEKLDDLDPWSKKVTLSSTFSDTLKDSWSDSSFSITRNDTSQDQINIYTLYNDTSTGSTANVNCKNGSNDSPTVNLKRRLSNSSSVSEVSFRLPAYETPAVCQLETGIDESIDKMKLFSVADITDLCQAYKKTLKLYTELAQRHRELEKNRAALQEKLKASHEIQCREGLIQEDTPTNDRQKSTRCRMLKIRWQLITRWRVRCKH